MALSVTIAFIIFIYLFIYLSNYLFICTLIITKAFKNVLAFTIVLVKQIKFNSHLKKVNDKEEKYVNCFILDSHSKTIVYKRALKT